MSIPTPTPDCAPEADRDAALMRRVRAGDTEAFEDLVKTHQSRVVGTVARMLGDTNDAEDIAQQVFVRVWKSAGRYRPEAKFTTWLHIITRNLVFNESRRRGRHRVEPLENPRDEKSREYADAAAVSPAAAALESELEDAIREAIEALPETQRLAVVLCRYEDLSYEEIAAVLKTSVSSVKSLLFRARQELRVRLGKYMA